MKKLDQILCLSATCTLLFVSCTNSKVAPQSCLLISSTYSSTILGARVISTTYYYANGLLASTVEGNGTPLTTNYSYDTEGRLIERKSGSFPATFFYYNVSGQLVRDSTNLFPISDNSWAIKEYTYNSAGQLVLISSRTESGQCIDCTVSSSTEYVYPNETTKDYSARIDTYSDDVSYTDSIEYDSHLIRDEFRVTWMPVFNTDHFPKKITSDAGYEWIYSYEFNSSGYPTKIQTSEKNPPSSSSQTFTYLCF